MAIRIFPYPAKFLQEDFAKLINLYIEVQDSHHAKGRNPGVFDDFSQRIADLETLRLVESCNQVLVMKMIRHQGQVYNDPFAIKKHGTSMSVSQWQHLSEKNILWWFNTFEWHLVRCDGTVHVATKQLPCHSSHAIFVPDTRLWGSCAKEQLKVKHNRRSSACFLPS